MRGRVSVLTWLLLAASVAQGAGGTAMDAYNFVTGARQAGMGGAVTAVVADPTALQWNPAGLGRIQSYSASLTHLLWVADISYSYLGVTAPVPVGFLGLPITATVGASLQALNYGPIESTRGLAAAVDASDLGFTIGGGLRFMEKWSGGLSVKYFRHALDDANAKEVAMDVGVVYEALPEQVTMAVVWQNVGYVESLGGHRPRLPMTVKLGGAVSLRTIDWDIFSSGVAPLMTIRLRPMAAIDFIMQKGEESNFNFGFENSVNDFLFVRFGRLRHLQYTGSGGGWNGGLGLKFGAFGSLLRLDYAFGSIGDLGSAQYMTLSWAPAAKMDQERKQREQAKSDGRRPTPRAPVTGKKEEPMRENVSEAAAQPPAPSVKMPPSFDVEAEYRSAADWYAAKRYAIAQQKAERIVLADSGHWQAWQLLGNCQYATGDRTGAVSAYEMSLKINPDNPTLKAWLKSLKEQ